MRSIAILLGTAVIFSGCTPKVEPEPTPEVEVEPYVSEELSALDSGTELYVFGNHMNWGTRFDNSEFTNNSNGPKLQRIDSTATDGTYVAVFRNNATLDEYGKATFVMPDEGGTYSGTTDLGYQFEISRSNDNLVYTLTGQFQVAYRTGTNPNRYAGGGFAAGSAPADGDMPTSGTASYSGDFLGYSTIADEVTGDFAMDANFASRAMTGSLTNLTGAASETISDVDLQATIEFDGNVFAGIADVNGTGTGADFPFGTRGKIEGGFYGPNGEEIGGTLRIRDGNNYLTGSFGGN